jgi:putative peptidoglycan lipid II flippase
MVRGRGSGAVGAGILLSRLAGLVREKLLAYHLGTGLGAEAFRAALRIPNLLQNLLGDGVLSGAFVPTYARQVEEERHEDAGRLAGAVASSLVLVTGLLVLLGMLFAAPLTRLLTPGFPPGSAKFELTVQLVRILTPSLGFLVLSAWCLGVLNAHRRFFRAYVAPVLWNATIIVALTSAALAGGTELELTRAVAYGALVGAVLQFLVQLPAVVRLSRGALRPGLRRSTPGLRQVLGASGGVITGRGIVQLSAYLDLMLASLLAAGAVAALGYAQVLYLLPVSLFGMSVAAASLPDLSTAGARDVRELAATLERGAHRIALLVLPTVAVYLTLGDQVVTLLFGGGAFGAAETRQVTAVLMAYALGLLASTQSRLLQSVLYGLDDTVTPARIAARRIVVGTTVGVALMLVLDGVRLDASGPVRVAGIGPTDLAARAADGSLHRLGAVGLALGASVGAWVEWWSLRSAVERRTGVILQLRRWRGPALAAVAVLPAALVARTMVVGPVGRVAPAWMAALAALLVVVATLAVVAIALDLEDVPGVAALRARARRRTARGEPRRRHRDVAAPKSDGPNGSGDVAGGGTGA